MHPQQIQQTTTTVATTSNTIPSEIITTAMRHAAETIVPIEAIGTYCSCNLYTNLKIHSQILDL